MGRGSWVMWVVGQLCDGSHGSWVTKDDPFPSLLYFAIFAAFKKSLTLNLAHMIGRSRSYIWRQSKASVAYDFI